MRHNFPARTPGMRPARSKREMVLRSTRKYSASSAMVSVAPLGTPAGGAAAIAASASGLAGPPFSTLARLDVRDSDFLLPASAPATFLSTGIYRARWPRDPVDAKSRRAHAAERFPYEGRSATLVSHEKERSRASSTFICQTPALPVRLPDASVAFRSLVTSARNTAVLPCPMWPTDTPIRFRAGWLQFRQFVSVTYKHATRGALIRFSPTKRRRPGPRIQRWPVLFGLNFL